MGMGSNMVLGAIAVDLSEVDAVVDVLGADQTVMVPAFPINGRTVYQGHLFVGDRLLNDSGMQHHPPTPMIDADLVRVLSHRRCTGAPGDPQLGDAVRGLTPEQVAELEARFPQGLAYIAIKRHP